MEIIIFLFLIMTNFYIVVLVIVILRPLKFNSHVVSSFSSLESVTSLNHLCLKVSWHKLRICWKSLMVFKNSYHCGSLRFWIAERTENYDSGLKLFSLSLSPEENGLCWSKISSSNCTSRKTHLFKTDESFFFSFHTFSTTYQIIVFYA